MTYPAVADRRRPWIPVLFIVTVGLLLAVSAFVLVKPPHRYIEVSSLYAGVTLETLADASDAIVLASHTGTRGMFWNSDDNKPWEPDSSSGVGAWIYRDDVFEVGHILKGDLGAVELTVRGLGGTVDDTTMVFEGQTDWTPGETYLLFLRQDDTPFQGRTERMWTVIWIGHGSFSAEEGKWTNESGSVSLTDADFARLSE